MDRNNFFSFEFLMLPRVILVNEYFKSLSSGAILLYVLLLDFYKLSLKNNWKDDNGKVFVKISVRKIGNILNCSYPTALKNFKELDDESGIGLIHIKRQSKGMPNLIYLNDFNKLIDKNMDISNNLTKGIKNFKSHDIKNLYTNNNKYINKNKSKNEYKDSCEKIIVYLNKKAQKNFSPYSLETTNLIVQRINEGYKFDDFTRVIDKKSNDWINNSKMNKFLRLKTLFGAKFENYLNEKDFSKNCKHQKLTSENNFDICKVIEKIEKMGGLCD